MPDTDGSSAWTPGGLGLAHRSHPPRAVAGALPSVGRDLDDLVVEADLAGPAAGLGEAHGVEQHPTVLADVVAGLLEGGDGPVPAQVVGDAPLVGLEHHPHRLQRLDHLDPERPHRGVDPVDQLARRAHHPVLGAPAHQGEGIADTARFGYWPEAHDQEQLVGRAVQVEVVAVVEVAIAGADVADRLRHLVHRIVVPGREHGSP